MLPTVKIFEEILGITVGFFEDFYPKSSESFHNAVKKLPSSTGEVKHVMFRHGLEQNQLWWLCSVCHGLKFNPASMGGYYSKLREEVKATGQHVGCGLGP